MNVHVAARAQTLSSDLLASGYPVLADAGLHDLAKKTPQGAVREELLRLYSVARIEVRAGTPDAKLEEIITRVDRALTFEAADELHALANRLVRHAAEVSARAR